MGLTEENKAGEFFKRFDTGIKKETKQVTAQIFTDKMYQAEMFFEDSPFFYDKNKIFWLWNNADYFYELTDEVQLLNLVQEQTGKNIINSKSRQEIINSLKQVGRKHIPEEPENSWIQFQNKIYDLNTNEEFEANPKYFVTNSIGWKLGKEEETLALDILFKEWVGEEHYKELYEVLAFCLVPNYFIHRLIVLLGSGSNGKGTFLKVLEKLIGKENIATTDLNKLLIGRFEGVKLLKKLVCLISETNFNLLTQTSFLKQLTGDDLIRAELKGKQGFDFRNYAKLIMASNSLPPTADKTMGFYRRFKIIDFQKIFEKETDVLINVLDEEYENLALKCFNIAKKLWKNRIFLNDGTFEDRKRIYEEKSNPMGSFIKENYIKDVQGEVLFSEFFESLNLYLEERRHRILSAISVSKQLKIEGFVIKNLQKKEINAKFIIGLGEKNTFSIGNGGVRKL